MDPEGVWHMEEGLMEPEGVWQVEEGLMAVYQSPHRLLSLTPFGVFLALFDAFFVLSLIE